MADREDAMEFFLSYVKSYIILFFIVTLLVHMVPKEHFQKYIRFFAQMLLVFGLLYPVLDKIGASDAFLEKIQYDSFFQQMEQTRMDAEQLAYLGNDSYIEQYETAIATDLQQILQRYGFLAKEVLVNVTSDYEIASISITLKTSERKIGQKEGIHTKKVTVGEEKEMIDTEQLKEILLAYYQLSEEQLEIF